MLQAEMGATVFYYPRKYRAMLKVLRGIVATTGTPDSNIRMGLDVNWQKVGDCVRRRQFKERSTVVSQQPSNMVFSRHEKSSPLLPVPASSALQLQRLVLCLLACGWCPCLTRAWHAQSRVSGSFGACAS